MVSNFCRHATKATFFALPAARRRAENWRMTGLQGVARRVPRERTVRTAARPPHGHAAPATQHAAVAARAGPPRPARRAARARAARARAAPPRASARRAPRYLG